MCTVVAKKSRFKSTVGEEITNLTLWSALTGLQKKLSSSLRGPIKIKYFRFTFSCYFQLVTSKTHRKLGNKGEWFVTVTLQICLSLIQPGDSITTDTSVPAVLMFNSMPMDSEPNGQNSEYLVTKISLRVQFVFLLAIVDITAVKFPYSPILL